MKPEFVVSACLAGQKCRYDGSSRPCAAVIKLVKDGRALALCPEALSGLPVPRDPCEQRQGKVVSRNGKDVSLEFEEGAARAFEIALASGASKAILKARSPSCGRGRIYDGSFSKRLIDGNGLFAARLLAAGFEVTDEDNLPSALDQDFAPDNTQAGK